MIDYGPFQDANNGGSTVISYQLEVFNDPNWEAVKGALTDTTDTTYDSSVESDTYTSG